MPAYPFEAFPN